ncbi:MAG: hypothetical protein WCS94_02655 [Verrucomicrobiota bacterium]
MKSKLLLGLALVLGGGLAISRADNTATNVQKELNTIIGWTNSTVKLVVPGSSGFLGFHSTKCKIEEVPEKVIFFTKTTQNARGTRTVTNWVAEVRDPYTKKICLVAPFCYFVVSKNSGMVWFWPASMEIFWQHSFFEVTESENNKDTAITRFISEYDNEKLLMQESRVLLRNAAPLDFFWQGSSIAVKSRIQSLDLTDGILRLDLLMNDGKGGKYTGDVDGSEDDDFHYRQNRPPHYGIMGSFWIDLNKRKVVKSVIDGYRMNLHTGGFAVPNIFTLPINQGTLRWGVVPALAAILTMIGSLLMARKVRSALHYILCGVVLVVLAWALIMLYRIYVMGLWPMDFPQDYLNYLGVHGLSPKHFPQIVVAGVVFLTMVQALLLRFRK